MKDYSKMAEFEVPLMVAISKTIAPPKYRCILVDKGKKFSTVYEEFSAEIDETIDQTSTTQPLVKVSSSETSERKLFNSRISIDQAAKILRADFLWVTFEFPSPEIVPPPNTRNAFDVLRSAQSTKSSLPDKYKNPSNGTFQLFNKLVDLCRETKAFFRYCNKLF